MSSPILRTVQTKTVLRHNGQRTVIGQRPPASTGSGVTDHGALTGLGDDDHTQYALADGTRGNFETAGAVAVHAANPMAHGMYVHTQLVPSTVWTVNHNLGWQTPYVALIDDTGLEFVTDIDFVNANTLTVTTAYPTAGTAYVSP